MLPLVSQKERNLQDLIRLECAEIFGYKEKESDSDAVVEEREKGVKVEDKDEGEGESGSIGMTENGSEREISEKEQQQQQQRQQQEEDQQREGKGKTKNKEVTNSESNEKETDMEEENEDGNEVELEVEEERHKRSSIVGDKFDKIFGSRYFLLRLFSSSPIQNTQNSNKGKAKKETRVGSLIVGLRPTYPLSAPIFFPYLPLTPMEKEGKGQGEEEEEMLLSTRFALLRNPTIYRGEISSQEECLQTAIKELYLKYYHIETDAMPALSLRSSTQLLTSMDFTCSHAIGKLMEILLLKLGKVEKKVEIEIYKDLVEKQNKNKNLKQNQEREWDNAAFHQPSFDAYAKRLSL